MGSDRDGFIEDHEYDRFSLDDDFGAWDLDRNTYLYSAEFYNGVFGCFDENEDVEFEGAEEAGRESNSSTGQN